ncbi:D-2-hydroxyacid dehydrogenase [Candidatus Woesearchaeota archaeon]|nr:D-2-hydroxyacid dehydrogenase [Candidatus Woesearchaeota archaeon]
MADKQNLVIGILANIFPIQPHHITEIRKIVPSATVIEYAPETIAEANIDILLSFRLPQEILDNSKQLKWVHALSAGVDDFIPKLRNTDIILTNSSGVHPIPIAEHVFGMLLMHNRRLNKAVLSQQQKEWKAYRHDVSELNGKTILILGYGAIGIQIGKIAKAFGMAVIGTKRTKTREQYADTIIAHDELSSYIPKADYIVIALPATPDTFHFFGSNYLALMKQDAAIVNIGRGEVIDEHALIETLKERKDITALLDVFETEPLPPSSPLWGMDNVLITAHYAGATPEYMDRAIAIFCANLKAYIEGRKMPNLVEKELGY